MTLRLRLIRWFLANALLAGIVFVCAGIPKQAALERYLIAFGTMDLIGTLVINPDLAKERSKPGAEGIDPSLRPLASALFVATVAVGSLDLGRFHPTARFSPQVQLAALTIFVAATALQIWAISVNAFFSTALRLQPERGHRLVNSGPYRYVRHPGYLAMLLIAPSTALALGSKLALLPAAMYGALLSFRAAREDRFLLSNLSGYADYIEGVRYRLIPGVW